MRHARVVDQVAVAAVVGIVEAYGLLLQKLVVSRLDAVAFEQVSEVGNGGPFAPRLCDVREVENGRVEVYFVGRLFAYFTLAPCFLWRGGRRFDLPPHFVQSGQPVKVVKVGVALACVKPGEVRRCPCRAGGVCRFYGLCLAVADVGQHQQRRLWVAGLHCLCRLEQVASRKRGNGKMAVRLLG